MAPALGRYSLCSKMTWRIGIIDDSTERVRKNHRMPKPINGIET